MAGRGPSLIGFDADDTLWHNEQMFQLTGKRFAALLSGHGEQEAVSEKLLAAERRNLAYYGYGVKSFTLSMIETAIEITDGKVEPKAIAEILDYGREMLRHPVETLPHVRETLAALSMEFRLVLITKGDLFHQEQKLAQSGLGDYFTAVEIVSEKDNATYERLFSRHGDGPQKAVMVGNSLKSDIVPALAAGCWGVHVPYHLTWDLELADKPENHPRFRQIGHLGELAALVDQLA